MNNIVSLSGGKDSTCMLIKMLEKNEPIHSVVFFDTGWEFPEMYEHITKLQAYTGVKIWTLHPRLPFDYWMTTRPTIAKNGPKKGEVHCVGNGWPLISRRWCTGKKIDTLLYYARPVKNAVQCVGYAADEKTRAFNSTKTKHRFPLQEYGITESNALKICKDHGFHWGGLYEHFSRVSCFCCPFQPIRELRKLRREFPKLWGRMIDMERAIPDGRNKDFNNGKTVYELERRFYQEDQQMSLLDNRSVNKD